MLPPHPPQNFKKYFDPLENLKKILPLQKLSFYNPLGNFNLAPPQKFRILDPLRKISSTGGCGY
jgi:hypothetical protein